MTGGKRKMVFSVKIWRVIPLSGLMSRFAVRQGGFFVPHKAAIC